MNLNPFIIGGILAYFFIKKDTTSKSKSNTNKSTVFIKPGYTIKDCKIITINDEQKALKQAFKYGANYKNPEQMDKCLLGGINCKLSLDIQDIKAHPEKGKFIYDLSVYYLSGALNAGKIKLEDFVPGLALNRAEFEKENISTTGWLTEKDIPQIIESNK